MFRLAYASPDGKNWVATSTLLSLMSVMSGWLSMVSHVTRLLRTAGLPVPCGCRISQPYAQRVTDWAGMLILHTKHHTQQSCRG